MKSSSSDMFDAAQVHSSWFRLVAIKKRKLWMSVLDRRNSLEALGCYKKSCERKGRIV
jgi:hypothetical protein